MASLPGLRGPAESSSEQVRRWIETPVEFWEECARNYGDAVALDLGSLGAVVLLSDPESVRDVFQLPHDSFECRQYNEHYRYVMGDNALLLQDGEAHRRQRRLLGPMLRSEQFVPTVAAMRDIAHRVLSAWPANGSFSPRASFHEITFQVMVLLLLGDLTSETSQALVSAYHEGVLGQVGSWGPWRNFTRLQPRIRALLKAEVALRRSDPTLPGALSALAQARDADGESITDAESEDHVFSLMIAGVDTTAISLTWAMYWLCCEDAIRARLVAELHGAEGANVLDLPYLDAVFHETLRMYPIVPTPSGRKLTREQCIGPHVFPAGTTLVPCTYLVNRREELYPNSHQFLPDRFLERKFASHEYFPFGGGARNCVGEILAETEFKVVLGALLSMWTAEAVEKPLLKPRRQGILLAPSDDFHILVRPVERSQTRAAI